jgi:protein SDA1
MVKRKTEIVNNLAQLQNLIKRDSASYQSEFDTQFRHFESVFSLFKLKPTEESIELQELLMFLSQVAPCFPKETKAFPMQIHSFLEENHLVVAADTRLKMVQALILMRNRNLIPQSKYF